MKLIFLFLIVIIASCHNEVNSEQTVSKNTPAAIAIDDELENQKEPYDSLIIYDSFADHPFHKKNNLNYFNNQLTKSDSLVTELEPNEHNHKIIDTVKTFYWGDSFICTIQNVTMDNPILNFVLIFDNQFLVLRNEIRIGQTCEQVFNVFNADFDSEKNYGFLLVESEPDYGGTNFLYFMFDENILTSIVYWPYIG